MTLIAILFALVFGYSCGAITLAAFSARAYSKGYGDGYNEAADRSGRTIKRLLESVAELSGRIAPVPASAEVETEEARRS